MFNFEIYVKDSNLKIIDRAKTMVQMPKNVKNTQSSGLHCISQVIKSCSSSGAMKLKTLGLLIILLQSYSLFDEFYFENVR